MNATPGSGRTQQPTAIPVLHEQIPRYLTTRPRWLPWLYTDDPGGRRTKRPMNPETGSAAWSHKRTWCSFERAVAAYQTDARWGGVGFVLAAGVGVTVLDLDGCADAAGAVAPWAMDIIGRFHSYTEFSPSGRGVHIFIKAKKRSAACALRPGGHEVEVYADRRFITLTGRRVAGTPALLKERQAELDALFEACGHGAGQRERRDLGAGHPGAAPSPGAGPILDDAEVVRLALKHDPKGRFARLMAGDARGYVHPGTREIDHSRAALALCGELTYWCGNDAEQIARIFTSSGLYQPGKWDGREGERTVARAIQGNLARGGRVWVPPAEYAAAARAGGSAPTEGQNPTAPPNTT